MAKNLEDNSTATSAQSYAFTIGKIFFGRVSNSALLLRYYI